MNLNFRTRVLLIILPIVIIPLIIIALFSSTTLFIKLKNQSYQFYTTVLKQLTNNIDFLYTQYATSFVDITNMDNFKKIVEAKKFSSMIEESDFLKNMGEVAEPKGNTIRRASFSKFKGAYYILDLDQISILRKTNYKLYSFSGAIDYDLIVEKFIEDKPYLDVGKDKEKAKALFIKPNPEWLKGFEVEKMSMFFYPFYKENQNESRIIQYLILNQDFLKDFYKEIDSIRYGTLYILDKYNNVMAYNHPSKSDYYYEYSEEKKSYIKNKGDDDIDEYGMRFGDYKLLNTDINILKTKNVTNVLSDMDNIDYEGKMNVVRFNHINYLFVAMRCKDSEIKVLYFHPLIQIYRPIYGIIWTIVIIGFIVTLIVIILSFIFSNRLNLPIQKLIEGARKIAKGNYKELIDNQGFFGEFLELGSAFNSMIIMIDKYRENLEEMVRERTNELNEANKELLRRYEENRRELLIAQKIQTSLIPKIFPTSKNVMFSGFYLPMEALGGDLYDVYQLSENKIGVLILDVCGHGVPAALITTMAKISFNINAKKHLAPKDVVKAVNIELVNTIKGLGDYLTAFYCVIDLSEKSLTYTNASHTEIIILRKNNNEVIRLKTNSPVVGVIDDLDYEEEKVSLLPDDRIVLYTDGVIEARDLHRNLYNIDRLENLCKLHQNKNLHDFVKTIYDDIIEFKKGVPQDDDIAILAIDYNITQ